MLKHLWDASGGNPLVTTQVDITTNTATNIITDASVPAGKRVVPVWMLWWYTDVVDVSFVLILRTTTPVDLWTAMYCYGGAIPTLWNFGATFINRCDTGVGLEIGTQDITTGTLSVKVGYYII